jgi:hypothetical protein
MTLTSVSSPIEARHWRHRNFYASYGQDRGMPQDQDRQLSPRLPEKSAWNREKSPSSNQQNGFGPAIEQIIRTCEQKSLSLKSTPFDLVTSLD